MITIGLVKELSFISEVFDYPVEVTLRIGENFSIDARISKELLVIIHEGEIIWEESLNPISGNFGIESCHSISQVLKNKIEKKDYKFLIHRENT